MFPSKKNYSTPKQLIELFFVSDAYFEEKMTIKKMIENILDISSKENLWDNINPSFIICNEKFKKVFKSKVLHLVDIFFYLNNILKLDEKIEIHKENEEFLFIFKDKQIEEIFLKENIQEKGIYSITQLIELVENYACSEKLAVEENKEIIDITENLLGKLTKKNFLHHNQIYNFLEEISVPFLSE